VHLTKPGYQTTQDELRIEKAIVAGLSMGGGIAMHMALSHSSRITALVLMSTTASEGTQESKAAMVQMLDTWFSTPSPSEELMDIAMKSWGGDPDVNCPRAQQIKRHWVERHSDPQRVGDVLMSVMDRENLLGRLHEIVVPVLIVHGEMDAIWPLEQAMDIRKGLINAKVSFEIIKGSGHLILWIRDSEDISRMIADFVNKEVLNSK
jgi:3-oxoadipate enol-lactonase